jgi:hypothetical protein
MSQRPSSYARSTASKDPLSPSHGRFASVEERFESQQPNHSVNTTIVHQPMRSKTAEANRATLSYCYTACLFFIALIVTWVPSTINRLYTLINNDGRLSPFGLDFASSLVLPLQGFWNLVIYVVTSWTACRDLWTDTFGQCCAARRHPHPSHAGTIKMRTLGSDDLRSHGRDPYPISPTSTTHASASWPGQEGRRLSHDRISESNSERADIVMSLDAHGRVIRSGRGPFDWSSISETRSNLAVSPNPALGRHHPGSHRGSQRSTQSYNSRSHSRQGIGRISEQLRVDRS